MRHFSRVDVLVNNAGIKARKTFLKGDEEEFDSVINTNLKAPIFLSQLCADSMLKQNIQGSIVNICSVSAHFSNAVTAYCAAKAGLLMASKRMALKLCPHKIRVNCVTPGTIQSGMNRNHWEAQTDIWKQHIEHIPMQCAGIPTDIANAVQFLSSNDNQYITGSELVVDGGWSLKPTW